MNKWDKAVLASQLDDEKAVIAALKRHYAEALREIDTRIKLLTADELTQSRAYQLKYQEMLRKQVSDVLDKLNTRNYRTLQAFLKSSYRNGFVGTMYSLSGQGYPVIAPINNAAVLRATLTNTMLSTSLYDSLGKDMKELKTTITANIARGLTTASSYHEIARNISFDADIPMRRAMTIARTESHRVQEEAANDARQAAIDRGCHVMKQWVAVLDKRTRSAHQALDGTIIAQDKPFEYGGHKAMIPGHFGIPALDINCRCKSVTVPRATLDEEELESLRRRAAFFGLDKEKSFKEFEKKYLKATEMARSKKKKEEQDNK